MFDSDARLQPQIATDGVLFKSTESLVLKVIPGKEYRHSVIVIDDLGHEVKESFRVTIQRKNTNSKISLDSSLSLFIGDTMKLTGKPTESATLLLHLVSPRHIGGCRPGHTRAKPGLTFLLMIKVWFKKSISSHKMKVYYVYDPPCPGSYCALEPPVPRHSYINLSVEIQHCPPGFLPDYNSECICDAQS